MGLDLDNLRTASLYINNQLLSRGLLRDGQEIDFADPGDGDGLHATMGRVMGVVNDLILRRDRDAQNRESLSATLHNLRAETQRQSTELSRQAERQTESQRRLDAADATERALRAQLTTAEGAAHKLKQEMARMRSLVAQTRAACAAETRRRDRAADALKKAVSEAGRVRGGGKSRDVVAISVVPGVGGDDEESAARGAGATASEGYSLREETNGFLTELASGLSDENEGLLALVRGAVDELREMSGLEANDDGGSGSNNHKNTDNHDNGERQDSSNGAVAGQTPTQRGAEELAGEMGRVLEHLRTILTNPSFVPIEEVEVRDDEIARLRAGFERLEDRWGDAVRMIEGWRRRMGSGGRGVDVEELSKGLALSPVRVRRAAADDREGDDEGSGDRDGEPAVQEDRRVALEAVLEEEEEEEEEEYEGMHEDGAEPMDDAEEPLHHEPPQEEQIDPTADDSVASSIYQDQVDDMEGLRDEEDEGPNVEILAESTATGQRTGPGCDASYSSPPLPEPPTLSPLKDSYTSGNRGHSPSAIAAAAASKRKRPGDFAAVAEEDAYDRRDAAEPAELTTDSPPPRSGAASGRGKRVRISPPPDAAPSTAYESPLFGKSGEKPSLADPSRKLFSRPSPSPKPAGEDDEQLPQQTSKRAAPARRMTRRSAGRRTSAPHAADVAEQDGPGEPAEAAIPAAEPETTPARGGARTTRSANKSKTEGTTTATTTASGGPPGKRRRSDVEDKPNDENDDVDHLTQPVPQLSPPKQQRPPPQSPLTMDNIAAKLAAAEREADAARVRAKLRAARLGGRRAAGSSSAVAPAALPRTRQSTEARQQQQQQQHQDAGEREEEAQASTVHGRGETEQDVDPVKHDRPAGRRRSQRGAAATATSRGADRAHGGDDHGGEHDDDERDELAADPEPEPESQQPLPKRKRDKRVGAAASRRASRRRSTLSPWELESLIQGGAAGVVESPAR